MNITNVTNDTQHEPKNYKNEVRKNTPNNSYSETLDFNFRCGIYGIYGPAFSGNLQILRYFLSTNFTTLPIGCFAIRRCKHRNTSKPDVQMHPEPRQNLTKAMPEKNKYF